MPTQAQSAAEILSLFVTPGAPYGGARAGRSFGVLVPGSIAAAASFTTSTTAIAMGAENPGWVRRGLTVYDASSGALVGTVWSWPKGSATLTLEAAAANASAGSSDLLVFYDAGDLTFTKFPGALQAEFLAAGYQLGDLVGALAYAVGEGWLTLGAKLGGTQFYVLQWSGFTEAGGSVPTMAASAQQAINAMVNGAGVTAGRTVAMNLFANYFVGMVGGNTFAVEDLLPGLGYAMSQGWLFLMSSHDYGGPVFALTAAGVAAAT